MMSVPGEDNYWQSGESGQGNEYMSKYKINFQICIKYFTLFFVVDQQQQQNAEKEKQLPSLLSLKVDPPEQISETPQEVVLPQALEDVLALKNQRALELGDEELPMEEVGNEDNVSDEETEVVNQNEMKSDKQTALKSNKNKRKKKKKKNRTRGKSGDENTSDNKTEAKEKDKKNLETGEHDVEVEYIQESLGLHELAPQYRQFFHIFEAFKIADPKPDIAPPVLATPTSLASRVPIQTMGDQFTQEETEETDEKKLEDKSKMSKRKLKKLTRLSVAELKQLVNRPDVVEMHDVTARDPKLLVQLKAHR